MHAKQMAVAFVILTLFGCSTTMDAPMGAMMSDAEIAAIVATANEGEIQHGNAASSRASASDVRRFAQMMVSDHTNALNTAREMFTRRGITPMENSTSETLRNNAQRAMQSLSTYSGRDFDRQYIKSQVDTHQWLLDTLDKSLIPSARNSELRQFLQTQRGAVARHLAEAQKIWVDIA